MTWIRSPTAAVNLGIECPAAPGAGQSIELSQTTQCRHHQQHVISVTAWVLVPGMADDLGELSGRTVGLVGFGSVARRLLPVLEALGATALYASRRPAADLPTRFRPLSELLPIVDILSLHLPLTPETTAIIDADAFAAMKRGSIRINAARSQLVDEAALIDALTRGHLRGAGLDVFSCEPVRADNALLSLPNVVATPHLAWLTAETLERSVAVIAENSRRLGSGEALLHRVL